MLVFKNTTRDLRRVQSRHKNNSWEILNAFAICDKSFFCRRQGRPAYTYSCVSCAHVRECMLMKEGSYTHDYDMISHCKSISQSSLCHGLRSVRRLRVLPSFSDCVSMQLPPSQQLPRAALQRSRTAVCTPRTCAPQGSIAKPTFPG
jgi:hypothetical protein